MHLSAYCCLVSAADGDESPWSENSKLSMWATARSMSFSSNVNREGRCREECGVEAAFLSTEVELALREVPFATEPLGWSEVGSGLNGRGDVVAGERGGGSL